MKDQSHPLLPGNGGVCVNMEAFVSALIHLFVIIVE